MACGLFHLMEDFILREVDYSQKYGYSSRAKRYMKRKLNRELAPFIEEDEVEDDEDEEVDDTVEEKTSTEESSTKDDFETYYESLNNFDSILIPKTQVEICVFVSYLSIILTFYGVSAYIITNYSNYSNYSNECKSS